MTVTPPTNHKTFALYNQIASLKTSIATNTNPAITQAWKAQLPALQMQLVDALMESGALPASAILSTMSFGASDVNT